MNERGTALVAALGIAMLLLPLGAFVVMQCRTDLAVGQSLRTETEAFYVAEAGIEHAIADIRPAQSFDHLLWGSDQIAGTSDDGVFPFAEGPPGNFPSPPFRYDVRITAPGDGLLHVVSQGYGLNETTKLLEALVVRSRLPYTPAALYVESGAAGVDLGSAGFLVSGLDHREGDPPTAPNGPAPPVPALALSTPEAQELLRKRLSSDSGLQLVGTGGAPSIAVTPSLGLETYASTLTTAPQCVTVATGAGGEGFFGTPAAPQLSLVNGDLTVPGEVTGSGVLLIRGTLSVTGTFAFTGIVLALGGTVFEPASDVTIRGALWRAASTDERLALQGRGALVYDSSALEAVDAAFPGLLPHAAVVVGWQEEL